MTDAIVYQGHEADLPDYHGVDVVFALFDATYIPVITHGDVDALTGEIDTGAAPGYARQTSEATWDATARQLRYDPANVPTFDIDGATPGDLWLVAVDPADDGVISAVRYEAVTPADGLAFQTPDGSFAAYADGRALEARVTAAEARLVPAGGTEGQVLAKASDTDGDTEWVTTDAATPTPESVGLFASMDYRVLPDGPVPNTSGFLDAEYTPTTNGPGSLGSIPILDVSDVVDVADPLLIVDGALRPPVDGDVNRRVIATYVFGPPPPADVFRITFRHAGLLDTTGDSSDAGINIVCVNAGAQGPIAHFAAPDHLDDEGCRVKVGFDSPEAHITAPVPFGRHLVSGDLCALVIDTVARAWHVEINGEPVEGLTATLVDDGEGGEDVMCGDEVLYHLDEPFDFSTLAGAGGPITAGPDGNWRPGVEWWALSVAHVDLDAMRLTGADYAAIVQQTLDLAPDPVGGTGTGDVVGPAASVTGNVAVFDDTTGKLLDDGGVALSALAPLASPAFTGTPTGITATHVGLGNVTDDAQAKLAWNPPPIIKPSATSRASATPTLAADPDLTAAIAASEQWWFSFDLFAYNPNTSPDLSVALDFPSGATVNAAVIGQAGPAASYASAWGPQGVIVAALTPVQVGLLPSPGNLVRIVGTIVNSTTPGTLALHWHQNTGSASNTTTIAAGSTLTRRRIS